MTNKFERVPVEEDTKILYELEIPLDKYHVLHQKWFWDSITAESIIFENEDAAGIKDDELEKNVGTSLLVKKNSEITLKRSESGFTFANFNFEAG